MKYAVLTLILLGLSTPAAFADAPCVTGNPPTAKTCAAGTGYAVTLGVTDQVVLSNEPSGGSRSCLQLQASTANTDRICWNYGAPVDPINGPCFELAAGASYYLFNLPIGNSSPQIINTPVHAAARSGQQVLSFVYCR